jgi:hypothetical protein
MYTKQQIIDEIRRISSRLNVKSLKSKDFKRYSKISLGTVRYHFDTWNEAIKEAGLTPIDSLELIRKKKIIGDNELLLELIRLYNEYGKEPTRSLIDAKGKYSTKPYMARWKNVKEAFLIAKQKFSDKVLSDIQKLDIEKKSIEDIKVIPKTIKPKSIKKRHIIFGEPINFRGLRFAPVNEQGVVYLFGMISHELGFLIESIRTEYPDCEGKRCFDKDKNQWEHVKIEFEYKSSHFKEHGHDEDDCDIIVCWIHDWDNCPIEVLELRSAIKYL